jgi:hypothetical protein
MKRSWLEILIGAAVLCGTAVTAAAQVPGTVPFTGRVSDASGPIDGSVSLSFSIFDTASGGTSVWSESYPAATASQGLVFIDLGSQTTLDASVFDSGTKYLEVTVNGTTLSPRLPIGSVPYAIRAGNADDSATVGGLAPSDLQRRVTGTCASGAISQVAADGTVTCVAVGKTYTGTAPITVAGTVVSLATGGCASGQALKYNGSAFACANDNDTNTTYTAGTGLTLNGTQFSADLTKVQARLTTSCAAGSSIRDISAAGVPTCETDDNTTYTAGTGLTLNGTQFNVNTSTIQERVTGTCPAGQSIRVIGATGAVTCEADSGLALGNCSWVVSAATTGNTSAACPSGKNLMSGGCLTSPGSDINRSYPFASDGQSITGPTTWFCGYANTTASHVAYALCCQIN